MTEMNPVKTKFCFVLIILFNVTTQIHFLCAAKAVTAATQVGINSLNYASPHYSNFPNSNARVKFTSQSEIIIF